MPADTASTESSMPQREMAMDFAARWPDRPEFTNVDVSALACKRPHIGTTMINSVLSEGRLCGLTPSDWSVLLGSFVLCGLLTLVL